jgi:hypothetical protein
MNNKKNRILLWFLILAWPLASLAQVSLPNPMPGATSIPVFLGQVIRAILGVVGAVALLMFVWGGILWMTSQGSSEKVKKGKETITWAIFGLLAIFFSYAVIQFIFNSLPTA